MIEKLPRFVAGAITMALLAAGAQAQGPPGRPGGPGGPGGPNLITAPSVQKELGLTEKQKSQLKKLETTLAQKRRDAFGRARGEQTDREQMRTRMEAFQREQKDSVAKLLEPKQKARLFEIELQRDGLLALARSDVAAKLKLSKEQSDRIGKIAEEMREAERNAMPRPPGRPPRRPGGNARENGGDRPGAGTRDEGGDPGGPPGEGGFTGGGPPGEGGFPGGGPPDDGGFPGAGPPGEDGFPGGPPGEEGVAGGPPGEGGFPGDGPPGRRRGAGAPPEFNREEFRAQFEKMRQERDRIRSAATSQITSLLSTEQQAAFKKLQGKHFDLASLRPGPGSGEMPRAGRQGTRSRPQTKSRTRRGADQRQDSNVEPQF